MGCPRGCSQLQGKRRINHSIPYTVPPLPPGKATKHPGSTCRALAAPPPGYWGNLGRCPAQPQHSPYPSAPREAREDARGSERASPPPSSSCCCFGNWGRKKKRGFIWESKAQAGLVGLGHVRVACRQCPAASAPARPGGSEGTRLLSLHRSWICAPGKIMTPETCCWRRAGRVSLEAKPSHQSPTSGFGLPGGKMHAGCWARIEKGI